MIHQRSPQSDINAVQATLQAAFPYDMTLEKVSPTHWIVTLDLPGPLSNLSSNRLVTDLTATLGDALGGVELEPIDSNDSYNSTDRPLWFLANDTMGVIVTDEAPPSGDTGIPGERPLFHLPSAVPYLAQLDSIPDAKDLLAILLATDAAVNLHPMTGDAYDAYGRRFDTLTLWLGLRRSLLDLAHLTGDSSYKDTFHDLCQDWNATRSFAQSILDAM